MAFGSLEIASIPRTQDYTVMKQNEDNKGAFQQMTLGQQTQKHTEQLTKEVHSSDNATPKKREITSMRATAANAAKSSRKMALW